MRVRARALTLFEKLTLPYIFPLLYTALCRGESYVRGLGWLMLLRVQWESRWNNEKLAGVECCNIRNLRMKSV